MNEDVHKPLIIGALVFLTTLAWAFFLNELRLTPDQLLTAIGNVDALSVLISGTFVLFAVFFSLTIGLFTAYSDKDERGRVYIATLIPTILALAIAAVVWGNFAQWYPLSLFYLGSIPLMLETTRIKRMELKNFPVFRSSFNGAQRGLQILGVGVLVTLALFAAPQGDALYHDFEASLFGGRILSQLDVDQVTADFLIQSQRNTLTQITTSVDFQNLRGSSDPDAQSFVQLIDLTLASLDDPSYRAAILAQVREQQSQLDPQAIVAQVQDKVPGFTFVRENYWVFAALLGSLLYFLAATFIIQPMATVFGTIASNYIPKETYIPTSPIAGWEQDVRQDAPEPVPETPSSPSSWSYSPPPTTDDVSTPTYEHVEEPPADAPPAPIPAPAPNPYPPGSS
ncbi:MAG: hypothetical protein Q8P05_04455 [Candidatus Diapherotrites archaeon]|nr:hypothetical protein [Candidatus Diapherotrites archaeon]MDZ4256434.1 hypothetical protein [archaeon]